MKRLALATALSLTATSAVAGNLAPPVMEPEVIAQDTNTSSGAGILLPLLAVAIIAGAVVIATN